MNTDNFETSILREAVMASVVEQRRARRWKMAFRFAGLALVASIFAVSQSGTNPLDSGAESHTAMIQVRGEISDNSVNNARNINKALRRAFESSSAKGIILYINSPGGSPVQSGQIADEIHRLRALHPEKPIHAVIGDMGASGGYYVAVAAQNIYADKASLVGSIGVTAANFGYVELLEKIGVERRAYTSGEHKAFLDPFLRENETETEFWSGVLGKIHSQFIAEVKNGRGERLKANAENGVFSGLIWTGEQGVEMGLIDGIGSVDSVARDVFKAETVTDYTIPENRFDLFARKIGASVLQEGMTRLGVDQQVELR